MDPFRRPQLVQGVVLVASLDPYLDLRALSSYTSISVRQLRAYISLPVNALPHYKLGTRIAVRRSAWDRWVEQFQRVGVTLEARVERHRTQQGRAKLQRAPRSAA